MRRDLSLIRRILEYAETNGTIEGIPRFEGFLTAQVEYHPYLCRDAHYLADKGGDTRRTPFQLTWRGHDALARFRTNDL